MARERHQYEVESMSESSTDTENDLIHRQHHWIRHRSHEPRSRVLNRRARRTTQYFPPPIVINTLGSSSATPVAGPELQLMEDTDLTSPSRGRPIYVGVVNIGDGQRAQGEPISSAKSEPPTRKWSNLDARASANALAILNTRGRSNSDHSHHRHHHYCSRHSSPDKAPDMPHIPPKNEEAKWTLAEEREKQYHDKELKNAAVQAYIQKQIEDEKERQRIIEEARRRERDEEEKKKAELETKKRLWEAEILAKKQADEEAKKKKEQDIEQAVRDRMAKAGYHMEDIEKVVEGKEVHYCHEHHEPHPCRICISKTTATTSVTRNLFGCKVRRDLICTETLRDFGLLYDDDPVSLFTYTIV